MERNSLHSQGYKLESQIREAFGRITYSQTCHDKNAQRLLKTNENVKLFQIILSAISSGGIVTAVITSQQIAGIIAAITSFLLLVFNAYSKNFNLVETAQEHQKAADLLWKVREEYVSLLTDFEMLSDKDIMKKRDELQERTHEIYCTTLRTDRKSYLEAQKSLQTEEEQTFSEQEIDIMLPNSIRRKNRNSKSKE